MKGMIDRIEGNFAKVLNDEGETLLEIPKSLLPEDAKEGSVIEIRIKVKKNKEREARQKVAKMIEKLKNR
jgi:hypothetical protein